MSATQSQATATVDGTLSRDTCFEILSNQRRRFALHYLKRTDDSVPIPDLVEQVTYWEQGKPGDSITADERRRVQTALQQYHLPKMREKGFVEYNPDQTEVSLTPAAANTEFYIEAVPSRDVPWSEYYVGLTVFTIAGLGGVAFEVFPFTLFTPLLWSVFVITMFLTSSLVHVYDTRYRMKLGAGRVPPEVRNR